MLIITAKDYATANFYYVNRSLPVLQSVRFFLAVSFASGAKMTQVTTLRHLGLPTRRPWELGSHRLPKAGDGSDPELSNEKNKKSSSKIRESFSLLKVCYFISVMYIY